MKNVVLAGMNATLCVPSLFLSCYEQDMTTVSETDYRECFFLRKEDCGKKVKCVFNVTG